MTTPTIEPGYEIITPENHAKFEPKQEGDQIWYCGQWVESLRANGLSFPPGVTYRRRTAPAAQMEGEK